MCVCLVVVALDVATAVTKGKGVVVEENERKGVDGRFLVEDNTFTRICLLPRAEQLVGRGLRLMWREPDYVDVKRDDRLRVLKYHKPPTTYIDTLSIVEHPAFIKFYDDLQEQGLVAVDEGDVGAGGATGDIITVGLREDYEDYDFQWPVILHDSIEELEEAEIDLDDLQPFTMYPLDLLRKFLAREVETFVSQESLTKTTFGKYKVTANLFNANGYNEYLQKLLRVVTLRFENCRRQGFPTIQINEAQTVQVMDWYIRTRLFAQPFDPFKSSDWKILLAKDGIVTKHIVEQFAVAIYKMQNRLTTVDAEVSLTPFSSLQAIKLDSLILWRRVICSNNCYFSLGRKIVEMITPPCYNDVGISYNKEVVFVM